MDSEKLYVCPQCGKTDISSNLGPTGALDHGPVLSQLRSRFAPSDPEMSSISSSIRTQRAEIEAINLELEQLKSSIKRLETYRVSLEVEIEYQTGLLSPIRQLPDELLSEIMLFCSRRIDVSSPADGVWQFERVCKRWQNVAIFTPTLWSSIYVFMGNLSSHRAYDPLAMANRLTSVCLQRSGGSSLSIDFIDSQSGLPSQFDTIYNLLCQYSDRWEDLSCSLFMLQRSPIIERGLQRLRSLELSNGRHVGKLSFDSFKDSRLLTELRLFGIDHPLHKLILPWSQLTCFQATFCGFYLGELLDILQQTPNLVTLTAKGNMGLFKTHDHSNSTTPVLLKSLHRLELEQFSDEICTILSSLTTPALSKLNVLVSCNVRLPFNIQTAYNLQIPSENTHLTLSIVDFIRRSLCSITSLSLFSVDSTCVSAILEETPTLTSLKLDYVREVEKSISELCNPILVPNLENLSLACKENQGMFIVRPLLEMGRNRNLGGHNSSRYLGSLRNLDLTMQGKKEIDELVNLLEPLSLQYGVDVDIHSYYVT